jgi:hypothetical protein
MGFRMFIFVKPKVSITQNHAQNSGPKFQLFFVLCFVLLFWPVWGLNPGLLGPKVNNGDQRTKRPTDLSEKT